MARDPGDGPGLVESKVRADIAALMSEHPMGEALEAVAITLARTLDAGAAMGVASIAKELRETLKDLAGMGVGGGSDLEGVLSTPQPGMRPEVGDSED